MCISFLCPLLGVALRVQVAPNFVAMLWSDEMPSLAVPMSAVYSGVGCYAMRSPFIWEGMLAHCHMGSGLGFHSLPFQAGHFMLVYSAAFLNPRV